MQVSMYSFFFIQLLSMRNSLALDKSKERPFCSNVVHQRAGQTCERATSLNIHLQLSLTQPS